MSQFALSTRAALPLALFTALSSAREIFAQQVDVPLRRYNSMAWPNGVDFGYGFGIAVGDFDGDGYPDVFQANSGNLWKNVGGTSWKLHANLLGLMPSAYLRYSASFGDYDYDGANDIAIEPYNFASIGDTCFRLLHNRPDIGSFVERAGDGTTLSMLPCNARSETICWGDVDGDGWLDFILPTYPQAGGILGNFLFKNLGPVGPNGEFRFLETGLSAGIKTTPWSVRPEGTHLVDADQDGDLDWYSNGTLYQNVSTRGVPRFLALPEAASGIRYGNQLDEGALLLDYDLDGDLDLFVSYASTSPLRILKLFENRGDGSFFEAESSIIDAPTSDTGFSAIDWDNDGDFDVTNAWFGRRNQTMETGQRKFTVATHSMPDLAIGSNATPCWVDWDKDGDSDCVLGKYGGNAIFYENTLYSSTTRTSDKRYVKVRVARDMGSIDRGLEVEFGARVEVVMRTPTDGYRRVKDVASSAGYLNQNEYVLTFGLPVTVPFEQESFDLIVSFPSLAQDGIRRVDKHVNQALGNVRLSNLIDREITVLRSGRVIINGVQLPPVPGRAPEMFTTNQQLPVATPTKPLVTPFALPIESYAGIEVDTLGATSPVRIKEVVIDGALASSQSCGGTPWNLALFEVFDRATQRLVLGTETVAKDSPRNWRTHAPTDWLLQPGRVYRVLARVTGIRPTDVVPDQRALTVRGSVLFLALDPCAARNSPVVDPANATVWARWTLEGQGSFVEVGRGTIGKFGIAELRGKGPLEPGAPFVLEATRCAPGSSAFLVVGERAACIPFSGGMIVPSVDFVQSGLLTDKEGGLSMPMLWPTPQLGGIGGYFQLVVLDPAASAGYSLSNAVQAVVR